MSFFVFIEYLVPDLLEYLSLEYPPDYVYISIELVMSGVGLIIAYQLNNIPILFKFNKIKIKNILKILNYPQHLSVIMYYGIYLSYFSILFNLFLQRLPFII